MSKKYKGSCAKVYRELFQLVVYDYLYEGKLKIEDAKTLLSLHLQNYLIRRYIPGIGKNIQILFKPHIVNFLKGIENKDSIMLGLYEIYQEPYIIDVIDGDIYLVEFKLPVKGQYNSLFFSNGEPKKYKVDIAFIYHLRDLMYQLYIKYDVELRRYLGWKKLHLRYLEYKSVYKVNHFVIDYLIRRRVPVNRWTNSVYVLKRHLTKNEIKSFRYYFEHGHFLNDLSKILENVLASEYHPDDGGVPWWKIGQVNFYYSLINTYKEYIDMFSIPQPHLCQGKEE